MRVFVTGATGLIGKRLTRALIARGDTVVALSRTERKPEEFKPGGWEGVVGDPTEPGPWLEAIASCNSVVHLAGEPITAKRWTPEFLERIRSSRVKSTELIANELAKNPKRADGTAKVFVVGSGVGYYGANTHDRICTESNRPGDDPMADICRAWEAAAEPARQAGVRVCHSRTGIVLDPLGGALPKLSQPFKFFLGGWIGDGSQWMSWIHHADMTGLLLFTIDNLIVDGAFNSVAPGPLTNFEFSKTLAAVLKKPCLVPVPKFALKLLLGGVAEVLAGGQRALPGRMLAWGYRFQFEDLKTALGDVLKVEEAKFAA